ncbi:hypothetical protein GCM10010207_63430 [Streptomyces atratus]|nr:hypothetical protein GCM10010207_63430 [Streptomyces atratus]
MDIGDVHVPLFLFDLLRVLPAATSVVGPAGPKGETGPAGPPGTDGKNGKDGADGQTCPNGYSLQAPPSDPDALVCRRTGADTPFPDQSRNLLGLGALATTSMYRRLDG